MLKFQYTNTHTYFEGKKKKKKKIAENSIHKNHGVDEISKYELTSISRDANILSVNAHRKRARLLMAIFSPVSPRQRSNEKFKKERQKRREVELINKVKVPPRFAKW